MTRIVVVEDEALLARALGRGLTNAGFQVDLAHDGDAGYRLSRRATADLIVLDLMLPSVPGLEILRRLRSEGVWTPVLVLSAKDSPSDRVDALEAGADDYLPKPFSFSLLVSTCRTLLRRAEASAPAVTNVANLVLDAPSRTLTCGPVQLVLTRREYELLAFLMRNAGQPCSREAIIAEVWGSESHRDPEDLVEVYIGYLRQKLDHATCGVRLQTVGAGDYLVEAGR